jgi:hypothetical protein
MISPRLMKKILVILVSVVLVSCFILSASAQSTVVAAKTSTSQPHVGDTITVVLSISNVQNLFGLDALMAWDSAVLEMTASSLNLGVELHSNGVLHGTQINTNPDNLKSGDIYASEVITSASYHLVAASVGASTSSFSGSGTIVTLTFKVVSVGDSDFQLTSDLADKPASGSVSNNINHQDTVDTVTVVIPEFPSTAIIAVFFALATAAIILSTKQIKKRQQLTI